MKKQIVYQTITYLNSAVWLINGLFCKVLNMAPRHEQIVGRILSEDYARPLTFMIGLSEIVMACWVLLPQDRKFIALVQMATIAVMNILEYILTPDLLLWGRFNLFFATLFIMLIYASEFLINKRAIQTT